MKQEELEASIKRVSKQDRYQHHDYYLMDELLTDEQKMARDAVRAWVKQEVSPIIEDCFERAIYPRHLVQGLAELGAFGPSLPQKYGCAGADETTYGLMMQELERCDSGLRSAASVQGSLVFSDLQVWN